MINFIKKNKLAKLIANKSGHSCLIFNRSDISGSARKKESIGSPLKK